MEYRADAPDFDDIALNPQFRENESALFHALLQATDYGILMSGTDRQDIIANRRLGELFELAPQDIVAITPAQAREIARSRLKNPEGFDERLHQIYADPELTYEDELELRTAPPRTVRRYTGPVRDRKGDPIGRLWTFLDITETKRLQAEVEAQLRARTRDFQTTSELLRAMNELGRLALQYRDTGDLMEAILRLMLPLFGEACAAALLLSAEAGELVGIRCSLQQARKPLQMARRDDPALAAALRAPTGETPGAFALWLNHRGGLVRKLKSKHLLVAALRVQERTIGVLTVGGSTPESIVLDRFQPDHLQAVMDQIALTLETHRLQSDLHTALESLQATQRRMVEIEKLRTAGVLAASVAHDIRNILSTMQMEIAMEPQCASESLCAQLNRFSALTHRLLAFSRPSVLETRPTAIGETIQRIVPLVAGQAAISGVEIRLDLPPSVAPIAADASQLEHLFVNLCLNAIQAMNEAGGILTLSCASTNQWLEILVEDTGCGIAPEAVERMFDPFFTTRANGMGLGLFSCKRIVEEHGGQLTVESQPGEGARFTVLLPVIQERE